MLTADAAAVRAVDLHGLRGALVAGRVDRHNADVRKRAPASRLVEWRATDGWGPLCAALGVPVPAEPFPVSNTSEQFRTRAGLDG